MLMSLYDDGGSTEMTYFPFLLSYLGSGHYTYV
jgi:hypothetical protein